MKKVLSVLVFALVVGLSTTARSQSNNILPTGAETPGKARETDTRSSNPSETANKEAGQSTDTSTASASVVAPTDPAATTSDAPSKKVTTVPNGASVAKTAATSGDATLTSDAANPLTNVYRVGVGDVLDIRLLNISTRESSLFSVMAGGILEYPLAGESIQVAGLTTDEIDERLTTRVKLYEKPEIVVSVREFMSHSVIVSGLVNDPGTKVLRREAMPLYVVLAEAQLRPDAGRATIVRADGQTVTVNISAENAISTLVMPGDVITVTTAPPPLPQFFYVGGQVNSPGQKDFHAGMTLTQAVLTSGGTTRFAGSKVKVSRQAADGKLVTTEYNLKQIESGKVPDPTLQSGDRLDISRGSW
ncbi:MAG: polysaccharide biosynthesis/export protein [Acidobacteriota bacterium]|jgi:protein involved in polysaccharide export with SLBB domain|nr:polysaccharide biosynthesis/export protein [Acidobacteriota bacterium]